MKEKVIKIVSEALLRFAKEKSIGVKNVSIIFKPDSNLDPIYNRVFGSEYDKDEDGSVKQLKFTKDILNKKFDLLPTELFVAQDLKARFKTYMSEYKIEQQNLIFRIVSFDDEAKRLGVGVYNGKEVILTVKAEDFF